MNIVLMGFMGAGKTKVGHLIAERLGVPFVDTDDLVEDAAGRSIGEIFEYKGESAFRDMETQAIRDAVGRGEGVVALGGGAATFERNWEILKNSGALTIYLKADVDSIVERIGDQTHRPLLAGLTREQIRQKVAQMLKEREPWYERADLVISSDNTRDKFTMADEVVTRLNSVRTGEG